MLILLWVRLIQMIYLKIINCTVLPVNINQKLVLNLYDLLPKSKRIINNIGSRLFNGAIIGDCVIVSDDGNEIEPFLKNGWINITNFCYFFLLNHKKCKNS